MQISRMKRLFISGLAVAAVAIMSVTAVANDDWQRALRDAFRRQQGMMLPVDFPVQQRILLARLMTAQTIPADQFDKEVAAMGQDLSALTTYLLKSDTTYSWFFTDWSPSYLTSYTYSGVLETNQLSRYWDFFGSQWVNSSQIASTYDGSSRLSTTTYQSWSGSTWDNESKTTYTYDGGGLMTQFLEQNWWGAAWRDTIKTTMTYSGGRVTQSLRQAWQGGIWVDIDRVTYSYDGPGNVTAFITEKWITSAWVKQTRDTITYSGTNKVLQNLFQYWSGSAWRDTSKYVYTYDGSGNQTLDIFFQWKAAAWDTSLVDTMKYSSGKLIQRVTYIPKDSILNKYDYTYDGNGNKILDLGSIYTPALGWNSSSKTVYVYVTSLAVRIESAEVPKEFELAQNYPNPFNPTTEIRYSLARRSHVEIAVFNVLGEQVRRLENGDQSAGVYATMWNGTDESGKPVASGIYFYRIKAGDQVETKKMVLLK